MARDGVGTATTGVIPVLGAGVITLGSKCASKSGNLSFYRRITVAAVACAARLERIVCHRCCLVLVAIETATGGMSECRRCSVSIKVLGSGVADLAETMIETVNGVRSRCDVLWGGPSIGDSQTVDDRSDVHTVSCTVRIVTAGAGVSTNSSNVREIAGRCILEKLVDRATVNWQINPRCRQAFVGGGGVAGVAQAIASHQQTFAGIANMVGSGIMAGRTSDLGQCYR